ncbi:uncharacterized protein LOC132043960 [Lycium ferocissimum]|uniref:uncharacterized protein LOC132043960 n=1 Tax=Lycium ferocissimum TaxID=112874 RepID=UPI0028159C5B|nr:uncharacterized protein LOC132043960 [Lycium ferocissimum]
MTHSLSLPSTTLIQQSITPKIRALPRSKSSLKSIKIQAVQDNERGPRRLIDIIRIVPEISRNYFKTPSRRTLFGGISLLGGFYVAQTISLSFGALGVNDVIAAVVCVLITEYVTRFYYSRSKVRWDPAQKEKKRKRKKKPHISVAKSPFEGQLNTEASCSASWCQRVVLLRQYSVQTKQKATAAAEKEPKLQCQS